MGSQQLLIMVLIMAIVGLAIQIGARTVESFNQSVERDLIVKGMTVLLSDARQYSQRPRHLGGGGGSFAGYKPLRPLETSHYTITFTAGEHWVLFQGYGMAAGWDGTTPVQVVAEYDGESKEWSIDNVN